MLEPEQHKSRLAIARREECSLSEVVRHMLHQQIKERKKVDLELVAKVLLADYQDDSEFTAFSDLDNEHFHA